MHGRRPRSRSSPAGRASGRRRRRPSTPRTRGRTAGRRAPAPSPTGRRRSRSRASRSRPACCRRPARRRCSACASRPGRRPRTCNRCARGYRATRSSRRARIQRRRPPEPVDLAHLLGDLDLRLGGDLLLDQRHREQRRQVLGAERLLGAGVKRRGGRRPGRSASRLTQCVGIADCGQAVVGAGASWPSCRRRRGDSMIVADERRRQRLRHLERLPLRRDPLRLARADRRGRARGRACRSSCSPR